MKIRRAEQRDLPRLNALLYQVHRVHAEGRPDIFRLGNKKYNNEECLNKILTDGAKQAQTVAKQTLNRTTKALGLK